MKKERLKELCCHSMIEQGLEEEKNEEERG